MTKAMTDPPAKYYVLLVEDNPADERLIREAFKATDPSVAVTVAGNGAEALALLRRERPNLIILDLNLPAVDGREVLDQLKGDKRMRHIPIVVFTSSVMPEDIMSCYRSGANCYLQKPMDLAVLFDRVRELLHFWTRTAVLPPRE